MKAGWTEVTLGDVATIDRRVVEPPCIRVGTPYVGLENLVPGGGLRGVAPVVEGQLASGKFHFDGRHVLFGKLRPNLAKSARPDFAGVCSTDILPLRPTEALDRGYLAHFIALPETVLLAAQRASGANLPRLSPGQLERFRLPLPPLYEQRRIASVLDAAVDLRDSARRVGAQFATLRDATFNDAFLTAGATYPSRSVGELADTSRGGMRTGPFGSQLLHSEFVGAGVAVLGIDNAVANEFRWGVLRYITQEKYAALRRYTVHPSDVLITIMGTCGRVAVVPDDVPTAINTKHICCVSLDRELVEPRFLHAYFLRHPVARAYLTARAKGAIMSGLNMSIIRELPVLLPPLGLQQAFVEGLDRIASASHVTDARAAGIDTLFGVS